MYYSYRRRSSGSSFFILVIVCSAIILIISPRARKKVGGCLEYLSSLLMGVGKDIGKKVNQVGVSITDKFRTYKLSDLTGGMMHTYTASKGSKVSNHEEEEDNIYFHDLTSRENQTDEDDNEQHGDENDIKKYPHE